MTSRASLRSLVFWLGLPFVLPQALMVRRHAPRFADAAGPASGAVGNGPTRRFLAVGDSIVAGVGVGTVADAFAGQAAAALAARLACRVEWAAVGRTGATASGVRRLVVPLRPETEPDYIAVSVGVNDVTSLSSRGAWARALADLLLTLRQQAPRAHIAVLGLPPMEGFPLLPRPMNLLLGLRCRAFDDVTRDVVAGDARIVLVPTVFDPRPEMFSADGYHPNAASCRELGDAVAQQLAAGRKPV